MNEKERLKEIIQILKESNILSGLTPEKFRNVIEQLGPTFIKIGQIMSNRADIFPEEYCEELSQLRRNVSPIDFEEIELILNEEYGDYHSVFSYVDHNILGSASIAQVYRAMLLSGENVVVKVQRKDIYEKMAIDIKLLKRAISILHLNNIFKVMDLNDVLDQIFQAAKEEMNFEIEASHIEEFNDNNKDVNYVRAPKVYKNFVTSKVLVMEEITGSVINAVSDLENDGYDLNEIGLKLCNNYIKQAIDDGFFHADPHPDNIMIQDGKIVYIDLGMMGRLSQRDCTLLKNCIKAIVGNDIYGVERILNDLSVATGDVDHVRLRRDIENILSKNVTSEIENIDIVEFLNNIFKMLQENNLRLDKNITLLIRGIGIMEGVLEEISPQISLIEVLSNKVKEDYMSDVFNKEQFLKLGKNILTSSNSITKIPNEALHLVNSINRGEIVFRVELSDSSHKIDKLEKMIHLIVVGLLDAALILGSCLVESVVIRNVYVGLGVIFLIWLMLRMFLDHIDKN